MEPATGLEPVTPAYEYVNSAFDEMRPISLN